MIRKDIRATPLRLLQKALFNEDSRTTSLSSTIKHEDSTQNYNRYSYCINNPLKYTDPSGYIISDYDLGRIQYMLDNLNSNLQWEYYQWFDGLQNDAEWSMLDALSHIEGGAGGGGPADLGGSTDDSPLVYFGISIDGSVVFGSGGTAEIGHIFGIGGYFSYGFASGWETSASINLVLIFPKEGFTKDDVYGMSAEIDASLKFVSVAVGSGEEMGYPENKVLENYYIIKIGLGPGWGASYSPCNNTIRVDWLQRYYLTLNIGSRSYW